MVALSPNVRWTTWPAPSELFNRGNEYTVLTVLPGVPPHAASVVGMGTVREGYEDEAEKVLKLVRVFFEKSQ